MKPNEIAKAMGVPEESLTKQNKAVMEKFLASEKPPEKPAKKSPQ